ncbi:carbon-nitrogen hydrolase family protein [Sediminispirochaeta bajacaliforniensis]|uniref:carbon-nitrogen hydrolase family protein n=1 Tax=Sediminispirochaeta bajacaliforniensis TaxID=148 RepID=UPI00035DEB6B|nr:carbon-nitrogen hydrolase family protein [Sediminispirochaeta bajacaliforniensis]
MSKLSVRVNYKPLLWFAGGFGAFIFTRVMNYVPMALPIAALLILRFSRSRKTFKGVLLTVAGFIMSVMASQLLPFPASGAAFMIFHILKLTVKGILFALPYLIDRLLYNKLKGFLRTLVFPVTAVTIYFLDSTFGLFKGTGFYYAFMQYGNSSLVQFLSIAGIWGTGFILLWSSSVVYWILENGFEWEIIRKGVLVYVGVMLLACAYGGIRTSPMFYDYSGKTVTTAAIILAEISPMEVFEKLDGRKFSDLDVVVPEIEKRVRQAADAGAEIAVLQEFAAILPQEEEAAFIGRMRRIATDNNVYLCVDYVALPPRHPGRHDYTFGLIELDDDEEGSNKALLIDCKGELKIEYTKLHVAQLEDNYVLESSSDQIPVVDTPYGRIGVVICKDMEFSRFMRQAAQKQADLIIAPSSEATRALAITYSQMLRAVEYGFSFIRPCSYGLSVAVDYHGNILASKNSFTSPGKTMYAEVPVKGTSTLYGIIGDLFAWICCTAFFLFLLYILATALRRKK